MHRITYHIILPVVMSVLFLLVAATPVEVLGCRNRGLMALAIALISGLLSLAAAVMALRGRVRGDAHSVWWVATSLVLVIPVIALIILA